MEERILIMGERGPDVLLEAAHIRVGDSAFQGDGSLRNVVRARLLGIVGRITGNTGVCQDLTVEGQPAVAVLASLGRNGTVETVYVAGRMLDTGYGIWVHGRQDEGGKEMPCQGLREEILSAVKGYARFIDVSGIGETSGMPSVVLDRRGGKFIQARSVFGDAYIYGNGVSSTHPRAYRSFIRRAEEAGMGEDMFGPSGGGVYAFDVRGKVVKFFGQSDHYGNFSKGVVRELVPAFLETVKELRGYRVEV